MAGSLKLGTVTASEFVRTLQAPRRTSTLAGALASVGRAAKSLFLLSYVDDEAYRRRILVQLNRHEKRHNLARKIFHGQRGEVRKRYRFSDPKVNIVTMARIERLAWIIFSEVANSNLRRTPLLRTRVNRGC